MKTYLKIATNTFVSHLKSENVELKIRYVFMHFKTIFNIKVDFESTFENSHYLHVDIGKIEQVLMRFLMVVQETIKDKSTLFVALSSQDM
jgi:hypothetical protein